MINRIIGKFDRPKSSTTKSPRRRRQYFLLCDRNPSGNQTTDKKLTKILCYFNVICRNFRTNIWNWQFFLLLITSKSEKKKGMNKKTTKETKTNKMEYFFCLQQRLFFPTIFFPLVFPKPLSKTLRLKCLNIDSPSILPPLSPLSNYNTSR